MSSVWKLCLLLWDSSLSFSLSFSLLASQAGLAHHSPDHCPLLPLILRMLDAKVSMLSMRSSPWGLSLG